MLLQELAWESRGMVEPFTEPRFSNLVFSSGSFNRWRGRLSVEPPVISYIWLSIASGGFRRQVWRQLDKRDQRTCCTFWMDDKMRVYINDKVLAAQADLRMYNMKL